MGILCAVIFEFFHFVKFLIYVIKLLCFKGAREGTGHGAKEREDRVAVAPPFPPFPALLLHCLHSLHCCSMLLHCPAILREGKRGRGRARGKEREREGGSETEGEGEWVGGHVARLYSFCQLTSLPFVDI